MSEFFGGMASVALWILMIGAGFGFVWWLGRRFLKLVAETFYIERRRFWRAQQALKEAGFELATYRGQPGYHFQGSPVVQVAGPLSNDMMSLAILPAAAMSAQDQARAAIQAALND